MGGGKLNVLIEMIIVLYVLLMVTIGAAVFVILRFKKRAAEAAAQADAMKAINDSLEEDKIKWLKLDKKPKAEGKLPQEVPAA